MVLSRILERFRRPAKAELIEMEDELLGKLTWDEAYRGWRGTMTAANGKTTAFTVDGVKTEESIPEAVRSLAQFLMANEQPIRDRIAVSMSEIYNGPWGGGDTMTPEQLAQRITLTAVYFDEEGGGELHYEAEDELFTDHTICAHIDANGEVGEPDLEG